MMEGKLVKSSLHVGGGCENGNTPCSCSRCKGSVLIADGTRQDSWLI